MTSGDLDPPRASARAAAHRGRETAPPALAAAPLARRGRTPWPPAGEAPCGVRGQALRPGVRGRALARRADPCRRRGQSGSASPPTGDARGSQKAKRVGGGRGAPPPRRPASSCAASPARRCPPRPSSRPPVYSSRSEETLCSRLQRLPLPAAVHHVALARRRVTDQVDKVLHARRREEEVLLRLAGARPHERHVSARKQLPEPQPALHRLVPVP